MRCSSTTIASPFGATASARGSRKSRVTVETCTPVRNTGGRGSARPIAGNGAGSFPSPARTEKTLAVACWMRASHCPGTASARDHLIDPVENTCAPLAAGYSVVSPAARSPLWSSVVEPQTTANLEGRLWRSPRLSISSA